MSFVTSGYDTSFQGRTAGSPPAFNATSPREVSAPSSSHNFDRYLQKEIAGDANPLPTSQSSKGTSRPFAGAHQTQRTQQPQSENQTQNTPATSNANARTQSFNARTAGLSLSDGAFDGSASGKDFSFWDMIDVINPLQHLPIVGTIYRAITGDEIQASARIMGGALYGGPVGAAFGVANAIFADTTGKDIGDNILTAMLPGGPKPEQLGHPTSLDMNPNGQDTTPHATEHRSNISKEDIIWSPQSTPSAPITHTSYPILAQADGTRGATRHSLQRLSNHANATGTNPTLSTALKQDIREQEEHPNFGQKSVGSPMFLTLQEVSTDRNRSTDPSRPIAHQDIPSKMIEALDKYKSLHSTTAH